MIDFKDLPKDVHHCTSFNSGDWIIWKCPLCQGYERKLNWKTGEMQVKGKTKFQHTGSNEGKENLESLTKNISEQ